MIKKLIRKIWIRIRIIWREIFEFIHNYTLEIILLSFIALGICWGVGYFCNAVYGMKFELQSCWAGFSAIGGAGVMASVKYCMDSWKNTPEGEAPIQGLSTSQRLAKLGIAALDEFSSGEKPSSKPSVSAAEKEEKSPRSKTA